MLLYWPAYVLFYILQLIYFPITIIGRHHIPRQGPCLIASNHISNLDPPLVSYAARRLTYHMAKHSLFKNKVTGWLFRHMGGFPVKRGGADVGAVRESLRILERGYPLSLFPLGTRSVEGEDKPPKSGIGFLAAKSGVPVIPFRIVGSEKVLPPGAKFFNRHPVTLIVGEPLRFSPNDNYEHIATEIFKKIQSLSPTTSGNVVNEGPS